MNYNKSRKINLEVTIEEMRNFSFAYIEKYAPSKQQLKTYLLKKYLTSSRTTVKKEDITNLIDIVINDLEKTKFISDKFYSESKARNLVQRGSSLNKISQTTYSPKSFNNKFGVPLSLFNLKTNDDFGVFEVGMDKKGEIDNLSKIINLPEKCF